VSKLFGVANLNFHVAVPSAAKRDLKFIPRALVDNCRRLIECYHDIHGYGCLPDILWRADVQDFVNVNEDLRRIFQKAAKTRSGKKANSLYLTIASALLSIEILANDLFGWGIEFPGAKRKAAGLLQEFLPASRIRLRDVYLCERNFIRAPSPSLLNAITHPPAQLVAEHAGPVAEIAST
jgi:hypothetical protein